MNVPRRIKGIYLIERISELDDSKPRYYVGQSEDIFQRFSQHCNGKEQYIDKEINRVGLISFSFRVLEQVSKKSDLDSCEQKWIKFYIDNYGEEKLYNIDYTDNSNPNAITRETRKEIRKLFENDVKQSIYAIASRFHVDFNEVIKIRKGVLEKSGLKYSSKLKQVVYESTNEAPENWMGAQLTKKIAKQADEYKTMELDNSDIAHKCNISVTDLRYYLDSDKSEYQYAPEI